MSGFYGRNGGPSREALERPSYQEAVEQGASASNDPDEMLALMEELGLGKLGHEAAQQSVEKQPFRPPARPLRMSRMANFRACVGEISSLSISPDGAIATCSTAPQTFGGTPTVGGTGTTNVWSISSGMPRRLHTVSGAWAVFSATPSNMATLKASRVTNEDGNDTYHTAEVKIKDHIKQKTIATIQGSMGWPLVFSPDGTKLAASTGQNRLTIYRSRMNLPVLSPNLPSALVCSHIDRITHAMFMPDNNSIVTLSKDSTLRITNASSGRTDRRLEIEGPGSTCPRALGISPDGLAIISIWGDKVHIWEHELDSLTSYSLNLARVKEGWPLAFSPDCSYLVCRNEDGLDISDTYTGKVLVEIAVPIGLESLVTAAAISQDGRMLAFGRVNGYVDVWDLLQYEPTDKKS